MFNGDKTALSLTATETKTKFPCDIFRNCYTFVDFCNFIRGRKHISTFFIDEIKQETECTVCFCHFIFYIEHAPRDITLTVLSTIYIKFYWVYNVAAPFAYLFINFQPNIALICFLLMFVITLRKLSSILFCAAISSFLLLFQVASSWVYVWISEWLFMYWLCTKISKVIKLRGRFGSVVSCRCRQPGPPPPPSYWSVAVHLHAWGWPHF